MSIYSDVFEGEYAVNVEVEGGVARIMDEQVIWYAEESDYDDAVYWAELTPSAGHDSYTRFCEKCVGFTSDDDDALPLMARFAAGKFDMTGEDGRAEALEYVFRRNEGKLAEACMLIDAASEGIDLTPPSRFELRYVGAPYGENESGELLSRWPSMEAAERARRRLQDNPRYYGSNTRVVEVTADA